MCKRLDRCEGGLGRSISRRRVLERKKARGGEFDLAAAGL
jgi:hypothetical protein